MYHTTLFLFDSSKKSPPTQKTPLWYVAKGEDNFTGFFGVKIKVQRLLISMLLKVVKDTLYNFFYTSLWVKIVRCLVGP